MSVTTPLVAFVPTSASPSSFDPALQEEVDRMHRAMGALFGRFREFAAKIKSTEQFSVHRGTFSEWSTDLITLVTKCEDVVFDFKLDRRAPAASPAPSSPKRKLNIADLVSQVKQAQKQQTSSSIPTQKVEDVVMPPLARRAGTGAVTGRPAPLADLGGSALATPPGTATGARPALPTAKTAAGNMASARHNGVAGATPRAGAAHDASYLVENTAVSHAMKMAASVHIILDGVLRAVDASTVTLYAPVNGATDDLHAVCDVGRGPDTNIDDLLVKDPDSAPCLAMATGIMVTVCRGIDPPSQNRAKQDADKVAYTASVSFRESVKMAVGHSSEDLLNPDTLSATLNSTSPRHTLVVSPRATPKAKRTRDAWSSVSLPIRAHAAQRPVAVLHVANKAGGKANFEPEDEHALYGVSRMLASVLQRHPDLLALAPHYQPQRSLPPVSQPAAKSRHAIRGAELNSGYKSQLVWRTWDHPGNMREVKITVRDTVTEQAVKLDERVPLTKVYDYIERLQTAWQKSAMLNIEYQTTFDQRTAYMTQLVHKLKSAAIKNEALQTLLRQCRAAKGIAPDGSGARRITDLVAVEEEDYNRHRPAFVPKPAPAARGGASHRSSPAATALQPPHADALIIPPTREGASRHSAAAINDGGDSATNDASDVESQDSWDSDAMIASVEADTKKRTPQYRRGSGAQPHAATEDIREQGGQDGGLESSLLTAPPLSDSGQPE